MKKINAIALSLSLVLLSGCTFIRAVTFNSDENSFKREGSKVSLSVFSQNDTKNICNPPKFTAYVFPAVIAAAGVSIVMNIAESEISGYLDKKKMEFTDSYGANINYKSNGVDPINCIHLSRILPSGTAFEWIGSLEEDTTPSGSKALSLKTKAITLNQASARTDSSSKKVDVTVEAKIDVTAKNEKNNMVTSNFVDKVLIYSGLEIGGTTCKSTDTNNACAVSSSWFPAIPDDAFVNLSIKVTEVGSGGDDFGTLGKQVDDNKKTLNDAVTKAITDALTPPAKSK